MSPISSRKIVPPFASAKRPCAMADRAGEGAPHVAEQLGLEQLLGDRAAVDGHEQALGAPAVVVDRAGDQLLAGAALAGDQHGAVRCRATLATTSRTRRSARALADDVLEAVLRAQLALQQAVLGLAAGLSIACSTSRRTTSRWPWSNGFSRYQKAPGAQRLDRLLGAAVARDHDAGRSGVDLVDLAHQLEAVDARHRTSASTRSRAARRRRRAPRSRRAPK